jgi:ribosomal protein S18 acetylase RimI-like enzyme
MTEITIQEIDRDDYDEAAIVCARAFIQTPMTATVMGGNGKKQEKTLLMAFGGMLKKREGKIIVAKEKDQIVGVMHMLKWPECQSGTLSGPVLIPALIMAGSVILRARKFRKIWHEHDPKQSHWHIDPLAVMPEMQGKGIGSKLLTYFCEYVDKENTLAYLETDRPENVRLYNRFGFEVKEEGPIFGINNYYMYRQPGADYKK